MTSHNDLQNCDYNWGLTNTNLSILQSADTVFEFVFIVMYLSICSPQKINLYLKKTVADPGPLTLGVLDRQALIVSLLQTLIPQISLHTYKQET